MEALIESCNSDIRLVLNTLQARRWQRTLWLGILRIKSPRSQMRRLNSTSLQFDDIKATATKDLELGAFNAADKCVVVRLPCFLFFPQSHPPRAPLGRLMSADARMPINERMNLVFQDADILPLFVQARNVPPTHE